MAYSVEERRPLCHISLCGGIWLESWWLFPRCWDTSCDFLGKGTAVFLSHFAVISVSQTQGHKRCRQLTAGAMTPSSSVNTAGRFSPPPPRSHSNGCWVIHGCQTPRPEWYFKNLTSYAGQTRKVISPPRLLYNDVSEKFIRPNILLPTTLESVICIHRSVPMLRLDRKMIRGIILKMLWARIHRWTDPTNRHHSLKLDTLPLIDEKAHVCKAETWGGCGSVGQSWDLNLPQTMRGRNLCCETVLLVCLKCRWQTVEDGCVCHHQRAL